eukprot:GHVL01021423.1.p1 GENE.GHVL01021423.1~~GHVL01021423.1.p1  ORF type:complete len:649 (-),score=214.17 GHVL01021423.1:1898-3790(-)
MIDTDIKNNKKNDMIDTDIKNNKNDLSKEVLLKITGHECIQDIDIIIYRDKGLSSLITPNTINFEDLILTTYISFSHNFLIDITPISYLNLLQELNINNNYIISLSPLKSCYNLIKLYANNNKIKYISSIQECKKLNILQLNNNNISDSDILRDIIIFLPNIKSLEISNNPCMLSPLLYHELVLSHLNELNGETIDEMDRDLSSSFIRNAHERGLNPSICIKDISRPRTTSSSTSNSSYSESIRPHTTNISIRNKKHEKNEESDIDISIRNKKHEEIEYYDDDTIEKSDIIKELKLKLQTALVGKENLQKEYTNLQNEYQKQEEIMKISKYHIEDYNKYKEMEKNIKILKIENNNMIHILDENIYLKSNICDLNKKLDIKDTIIKELKKDTFNNNEIVDLKWKNNLLNKRLERLTQYAMKTCKTNTFTRPTTAGEVARNINSIDEVDRSIIQSRRPQTALATYNDTSINESNNDVYGSNSICDMVMSKSTAPSAILYSEDFLGPRGKIIVLGNNEEQLGIAIHSNDSLKTSSRPILPNRPSTSKEQSRPNSSSLHQSIYKKPDILIIDSSDDSSCQSSSSENIENLSSNRINSDSIQKDESSELDIEIRRLVKSSVKDLKVRILYILYYL